MRSTPLHLLRTHLFACAAVLLPIVPSAILAQPGAAPAMHLEPHRFRAYDGRETDAEAGWIAVPERRADPRSRTVRVGFVRLRTAARNPDPPVVWFAGGPGVPGTAMARVPVYFVLFERLRARSDVILFDQRGVGSSAPALDCPATDAPADVFASEARWSAVFWERTRACARRWRRAGADLDGYTTEESADDVDDLRRALGYERVSLIGHSYGTVLAQAVLQRHGPRVHRAVLAAVDGPDDRVASPEVWDLLFHKLGALAARDTALGGAVPDLPALYARVLARLDRAPAELAVTQRPAGRPVTIRVGAVGLRWVMRLKMTDARSYATIPALLLALDRGDHAALAREIEPLYNSFSRSIMATAIDCAGGWPTGRLADARRRSGDALFGTLNLQWEGNGCERAGLRRGTGGPLIFSPVPTLFLSGTLDTVTPPHQAEAVRWGFPASTHLVIENSGHEMLPAREVQEAVAAFLAGEDVSSRRIVFAPPRFMRDLPPPSERRR
ncbi:MAG TPA: alpha/beta fold hydrolase [Longimicrobium sp.]